MKGDSVAWSGTVYGANAQGEAHTREVSAEPLGRFVPRDEVEASLVLGIPLGRQGLKFTPCAQMHAQATSTRVVPSPRMKNQLHLTLDVGPKQLNARGFNARKAAYGQEGTELVPVATVPESLGFRPDPHDTSRQTPESLRFRPDPHDTSRQTPESIGFRPESNPCPSGAEASICSLPLAALVCRPIREQGSDGTVEEADIVVEDLELCARPGGVQRVGEHLDQVAVELRHLCEQQRQIVLGEADKGLDCSHEVQELNRLVVLEEELAQELAATRGDDSLRGRRKKGSRC